MKRAIEAVAVAMALITTGCDRDDAETPVVAAPPAVATAPRTRVARSRRYH